MKLNLIFIVMDVLTLMAYPFVFMHGKFRKFSKVRVGIAIPVLLTASSVVSNG